MANTFKNSFLNAVGTTKAAAYTAGAGVQATVIGMSISNLITTPISANVIVTSGGTDYYMIKNATIAPGGALVPIGGDQKLVLEATDILSVNTSIALSADVITSILEIT
jgi:hypothetical protein